MKNSFSHIAFLFLIACLLLTSACSRKNYKKTANYDPKHRKGEVMPNGNRPSGGTTKIPSDSPTADNTKPPKTKPSGNKPTTIPGGTKPPKTKPSGNKPKPPKEKENEPATEIPTKNDSDGKVIVRPSGSPKPKPVESKPAEDKKEEDIPIISVPMPPKNDTPTKPPKTPQPSTPNTDQGKGKIPPAPPMNKNGNKSEILDYVEWDFLYNSHTAAGRKFNLKHFSLPVPGEPNLELEAVTCKPANGYTGYYEAQKANKKRIVMHFTVGNLKSDVSTLTPQKAGHAKWRMSVPFLIARDGTIYQLFPSKYWSHHLGSGAIGGNEKASKESIGIELSNYGPLVRDGNNLLTAYSKPGKPDVYCTINETQKYTKLPTPFKGYQYFATFTDEQYESLIVLLRYLTNKYKIPRKFLSQSSRFKASSSTAGFRGINTHLNYRKTGKWDIGPAFDWEQVISGVQARRYVKNKTKKN